ncbi:hypothetical protein PVK06_034451 [Gossypium arboreum]|uniref:Uncharacterized protein n=1 Tax=Gossypium arboreum TaxID=29729 RepID=A0ABR0NGC2_GOSAR|nr:hypothetical protein PVK06_034451 [Gossypium arboreum]
MEAVGSCVTNKYSEGLLGAMVAMSTLMNLKYFSKRGLWQHFIWMKRSRALMFNRCLVLRQTLRSMPYRLDESTGYSSFFDLLSFSGCMSGLIEGLLDSVALRCLARAPFYLYPKVELVSRSWRAAIRGSELFKAWQEVGSAKELL